MNGGPNSMITVLVTGIGAIIGQGIIKSLRQSRYAVRIVGIDRSDQSPGPSLCDVFRKKPSCEESEYPYREFWDEVLRKEGVDVVLPGLEHDVLFLNGQRDAIQSTGARLAMNRRELIELCADKWLLGEELARRGLPCIPTTRVHNWQDAVVQLGPPPLLLKPRSGNGSRGIVTLNDDDDFRYWRGKAGDNWILQRIIGDDRQEYSVGVFGLGDGRALDPIIFRRRLSSAGFTQEAQVVVEPVIEAAAHRLTSLLRPLGPTNYQFRKDGDTAYLLEINPRFSSTTSLRCAFGYNEAEMAVEFFLFDRNPPSPRIRHGRAWRFSQDFVIYDRDPV